MSEKRIVSTRLKHKDEWFKMIAVAEACQLPILLIGPPGTGKTNTLLDYAKAKYHDPKVAAAKSFIIEVDEGTKSTEIKGRIDLEALTLHHRYDVLAPIVDAEFVLINEVDKASSSFRNSMLSCMNERELMQGHRRVPLVWDVWCASCNTIPEDEKGSPFWDRFALKVQVDRLTKTQISKLLTEDSANGNLSPHTLELVIPTLAEIESMTLDQVKFKKFIEHTHQYLSDRTLTRVPNIVRAIQIVYNLPDSSAFVKACNILAGMAASKALSADIEPKELIAIREKIEKVQQIADGKEVLKVIAELRASIKDAHARQIISEATKATLIDELRIRIAANKHVKINVSETPTAQTA